jgi:hypothetical protein
VLFQYVTTKATSAQIAEKSLKATSTFLCHVGGKKRSIRTILQGNWSNLKVQGPYLPAI